MHIDLLIMLKNEVFISRLNSLGTHSTLPWTLQLIQMLRSKSTHESLVRLFVKDIISFFENVDFYSGITLKALGFPVSMFTVLFAVARTVGWIAQWKEMIEDPGQKIGRPRQLYIGAEQRDYAPIGER